MAENSTQKIEKVDEIELVNNKAFSDEQKQVIKDFVDAVAGKTEAQKKEIIEMVETKFKALDEIRRKNLQTKATDYNMHQLASQLISPIYREMREKNGTINKAVEDLSEVMPDGWLEQIILTPEALGFYVAGLFPSSPANTKNFYVPTANLTPFTIPLDKASPTFTMGLDKENANAIDYLAQIKVKDSDLADSIGAVAGMIMQMANYVTSGQFEHALISGDNTSPHMDASVTTATDYRASFKGLRKLALDSTPIDLAGTITYEKLLAIRQALSNAGVNPQNLAYIMDVAGYLESLATMSDARTIEKFGNRAIIVNGILEAIAGSPVIVSPCIPLTDSDGYVKGTGADVKSSILCANTSAFYVALRANMEVKVQPEGWDTEWYFKVRKGFAPLFPAKKMVAIGINL